MTQDPRATGSARPDPTDPADGDARPTGMPRIPTQRGRPDAESVPASGPHGDARVWLEPDRRVPRRPRPRRARPPVVLAVLGAAVATVVATADAPAVAVQAAQDPGAPPISAGDPVVVPGSTAGTTRPGPTVVVDGPGTVLPVRMEPVALATALPDDRARIAVRTAMAQIGLPYVWGGDGPRAGDAGFDCSGLTHFAYERAGVELPRTAHTQFRTGPRVPAGAPLQPGDLVFYGTYQKVHHVGMYIGAGRMVNAPTFGRPVQTAWYRWAGDDYIGASRPASSGRSSQVLADVPDEPDVRAAPTRPEFVAPSAPRPTVVPEPRDPQPPEGDSANQSRTGAGSDIASGRVPPPPPATLASPVPVGPTAPSGTATPEGLPDTPSGGSTPTSSPTSSPTPTTSPSATNSRPTPQPSTSDRPTGTPTSTTSPTSPPTVPVPEAERATLRVGTREIPLRVVAPAADGLPAGPGVVQRGTRWVVVTPDPVAAAPGTVLTLRLPDGRTLRWTVLTRSGPGPRAVPTGAPTVAVLAPAGDGRWTVLTAR